MGVNEALEPGEAKDDETGAGDQGMMFGYACDETPELMPVPISLAHQLAQPSGPGAQGRACCAWLRPDGKSQVTVQYDEDGSP